MKTNKNWRDLDDLDNAALDEIALRQERRSADGARSPHEPLAFVDITAWSRRSPPQREWAVPDRFPLRNVGLLSGEGSTGKTILIMQVGAAHVFGRDWCHTLPEPGPFLYFNAEDEPDELERRLNAIAQHYDVPITELERDYHIVARAGQDAILGYPDHNGLIQPTPLFEELNQAACDIRPKMIALDTSADIFGGNEISRTQVRQFIGLLRKMAIASNSAVLIAVHPSLTGINTGTGLSGSTAWHNSVRARAYLTSEKTEDGQDTGLRQLDFMKNNYGPISASVTLQWKTIGQAGVYLPVSSGSSLDRVASDAKAEHVFLDLLRSFTSEGREVSHKIGPSFAPAQFAQTTAAQKLGNNEKARKRALTGAMNRLFEAKKIKTDDYGRPSRRYSKIVEQQEQPDAH
jgi:RecA-family ATPase